MKKSPQPADLVKKQLHQLVEFLRWHPALEVRWIQLSRLIFGACGDKNPHLETNEQQVKIPIPLKKPVEVDTHFSWNLGGLKLGPSFFSCDWWNWGRVMFWIQPAKTYIPSNTSRMFWHHIQCSQWKVGAMIPPPKKKRIKVEKNEPKHFKEEDQSAGTFESFKKSPASVLRHPRCLAIENRFIFFFWFLSLSSDFFCGLNIAMCEDRCAWWHLCEN